MKPISLRSLLWLVVCAGFCAAPAAGLAQSLAEAEQTPAAYLALGDRLLEDARVTEARDAYEAALRLSDTLVDAEVGLARTALQQERWQEAEERLSRVLATRPGHLPAHYFRGIAHREIAKYRTISQALHWSEAERDFEHVLGADSLYRDVLYQYALLRRYHDAHPEAILLGAAQVRLRPELDEPQRGLVRFYRSFVANTPAEESLAWLRAHPSPLADYFVGEVLRRQGDLQEADGIFIRLLRGTDAIAPQPVLLSRARIYYAKGEPERAEGYVMDAIRRITRPFEAALVMDDFKYLVTAGELEAYDTLRAAADYQAFFNGFWAQRDPAPARRVNARLAEHYRRLAKAEKDYAFDGFRLWHNDPDRLGELEFPPAYALNEEFNDKGLVFIRHGEPDEWEAYVGGDADHQTMMGDVDAYYSPVEHSYQAAWRPNESWRYRAARMDFHFVIDADATGNNWRLTPVLMNLGILENLEHWGAPYSDMVLAARAMQDIQGVKMEAFGQQRPNALDEEATLERLRESDSLDTSDRLSTHLVSQHNRAQLELSTMQRRFIEQSRKAVMLGLSTETHTWDEAVEPLQMPHVFAAFRGDSGRTVVEVHFALPIGRITQRVGADAGTVDVQLGYTVHDMRWQPMAEELDTKRLPTTPDETAAVIDFFRFTVPPDSFHVSLYGEPVRTEQLGGYKVAYAAPDYGRPGLALSDLLLAESIAPAEAPSRFNKRGLHLSPNPFGRFSTGQPVFVYFEVYDLAYGPNDQTRFTVEYVLTPEGERRGLGLLGRGGRPALALQAERTGTERSPAEYAEIDVRKVDPGRYTLTVRVRDEVTGAAAEQTRPLELFKVAR